MRQCLEFLKLGLQGTTVLVASGDAGAAAHDGTCLTGKDGDGNNSRKSFSANFPASCPWVTAVGGTQPAPAGNPDVNGSLPVPAEETYRRALADNTTIASSGGGFSNTFPTPFYQVAEVRKYMEDWTQAAHLQDLQQQGYFDSSGRVYPDISGLAVNYLVSIYGKLHSIHGTSASTPLVASMISLINDMRLHAGKAPVGFINPVIYNFRDGITRDVVNGYNEGCGIHNAYPAVDGWDTVTGLGTLAFKDLGELYLQLP